MHPTLCDHVIAAPDSDYIDLTLDQFLGYHDQIVAEPVESGGQLTADFNRVSVSVQRWNSGQRIR